LAGLDVLLRAGILRVGERRISLLHVLDGRRLVRARRLVVSEGESGGCSCEEKRHDEEERCTGHRSALMLAVSMRVVNESAASASRTSTSTRESVQAIAWRAP